MLTTEEGQRFIKTNGKVIIKSMAVSVTFNTHYIVATY